MNAYRFGGGKELRLAPVPVPQPTDRNVICRVVICSICGTDMRTYTKGSNGIDIPRTIGHEIHAEIIHIGDAVGLVASTFHVGQRVNIAPAIGCGECYSCRRGATNLCANLKTIGFQHDGGFAEYLEVPLQAFRMGNVIPIPDELEPEDIVLCEPVACVVNGQEKLNIRPGDTVAIFGAGFIGCMHAELAKIKGAEKIIMVEFSGYRADQAKEMIPGITMINPDREDVVLSLRATANSVGPEVLVTACSVGKTHTQALEAAAPGGRICLFGGLPDPSTGFIDSNVIHYKELGVFGVHASTATQNREVLDMVAKKKLNMRKYISRTYPLERIDDAFRAVQEEALLKAIIRP
jgi:L-iditol 2-dehydrogenase